MGYYSIVVWYWAKANHVKLYKYMLQPSQSEAAVDNCAAFSGICATYSTLGLGNKK